MTKKKLMQKALRLYAGEEAVSRVLSLGNIALEPGVIKTSGTVLYIELTGMPQFWVQGELSELISFLNKALDQIFNIIEKQSGCIAHFDGDTVLCFWENRSVKEPAISACCAALDLIGSSELLSKILQVSGIRCRIAISSGVFYIGNVGAKQRLKFDIIGETVNLGIRLCSISKMYDNSAIICEETEKAVQGSMNSRQLDTIRVFGRGGKLDIFDLVSLKGNLSEEQQLMINLFNRAQSLFKNRQFTDALVLFEECATKYNDNISNIFVHRCRIYAKDPPPDTWDGIYKIET